MSHTKEPWTYARIEATPTGSLEPYSPWIDGAGPRLVTVDRSKCIHADDMRRIVACVNACAGLSTHELEAYERADWLSNGLKAMKYKQQRDVLLAAAENLVTVKGRYHTEKAYKALEATIAKVKP